MKLHYPHTTLTGKDLANGFARAELQFDRALEELSDDDLVEADRQARKIMEEHR